jgi:hypothetical protein
MSEEFQRQAEVSEEAARRFPYDTSMQKAFIEGAEWGSRPF